MQHIGRTCMALLPAREYEAPRWAELKKCGRKLGAMTPKLTALGGRVQMRSKHDPPPPRDFVVLKPTSRPEPEGTALVGFTAERDSHAWVFTPRCVRCHVCAFIDGE